MPTSTPVAFVIPAYNEGREIGEVVRMVLRQMPARVIVVDDGSKDDTGLQAGRAGAEVVTHAVNLGQGAALQTGLRHAVQTGARWIVTFDADGQHDAADAARMVAHCEQHGLDICMGSRFLGSAPGMPRSRRLLLRTALAFQRLTTGMKLTDVHNGLRVLSAQAASRIDLRQNRMAHASEFVSQISELGLRWAEEPVTIRYTEYSRAKGQSALGALNILFDLLLERLGR